MILTALRIFMALVADAIRTWLDPQPSRRRWYQQEWGSSNSEYTRDFRQEEYAAVHERVGETLTEMQTMLGSQVEQDQEEPPRLTPILLMEELQYLGEQARDMGLPFVIGVQVPGHARFFLASNITPDHTDTQILCAYHDLSRW